MPTYFSVGTMSLPVDDAEVYDDYEYLCSRYFFNGETDNYNNYYCTDDYNKKYFINTNKELVNTLDNYKIDPRDQLLQLPLIAETYELNKTVYIIHNDNVKILGTDRNSVIMSFVRKSRYPFSIISAFVALGGILYMNKKPAKIQRYHYNRKWISD